MFHRNRFGTTLELVEENAEIENVCLLLLVLMFVLATATTVSSLLNFLVVVLNLNQSSKCDIESSRIYIVFFRIRG